MRVQRVELGERSYSIYIDRGLMKRIAESIVNSFAPTSICIVTDSNVATQYLSGLEQTVSNAGVSVCSFVIKPGESSKDIRVLESLCAFLIQHKMDRKGLMIALGGGVVGDLTGFAASIYKRGIDYVQIPTSVVAQTDSSVGGKTAVDFCGVKNTLGTVYQPKAVYIDPEVLETLPKRFLCDGLGEVVKYALLAGGTLFERVMNLKSPEDFLQDDGFILEACVAYKKQLVEQDERDTGLRMLLNLGHTIGHAIESYYSYGRYTHGEAVAIGLIEILDYAVRFNGFDIEIRNQVYALLSRLELPCIVSGNRDEIFTAIQQDKKCKGNTIRIALPYAPGDVRITHVETTSFLNQISQIGGGR